MFKNKNRKKDQGQGEWCQGESVRKHELETLVETQHIGPVAPKLYFEGVAAMGFIENPPTRTYAFNKYRKLALTLLFELYL